MAISFPVSLTDFFGSIGVASASLDLSDPRSDSMTRDGDQISMNVGTAMWYGTVDVVANNLGGSREAEARARILKQAGASFIVTDGRQAGPAQDPDGAILGAATPTISDVNANNVEIDIAGLPAGYELQPGDKFSFEYGDPVRRAFHEVVAFATADGSGDIAGLDIQPRRKPGVTNGTALKFINAECEAVLVPKSFSPVTHQPVVSTGYSFSFVQTNS